MSTAHLSPPDTVDDPEALGDEIAAAAARMASALGHWLELVARFDACEGWVSAGARSCAEWLAWRCSLSTVTAREHVRVARRLRELPLVAAALQRGELSYSKVRAVTRLEHINDEERVVRLARDATASQLERFVRLARRVPRDEAMEAVQERSIDIWFDDDGSAMIRGRVPAEDGVALLRALEHVEGLLNPPPRAAAEGDPPAAAVPVPTAARHADALAWIAHRALSESAETVEGGGRPSADENEVLVHIDARLLSAPAGVDDPPIDTPDSLDATAPCSVGDLAPIAIETARRLCCDGGIVPVVRDGDRTIAVGRRTRAIPPAIRRALRVRRPCCAFPGCTRTRWLDAHHVVHWAHGGTTDLDNLIQLCRHHHRLVHEGGWTVRSDGRGGFEVRRPDGRLLLEAPATVGPDTSVAAAVGRDTSIAASADVATAPVGRGHDASATIAARALAPLSAGERYDLDLTIEALLDWTQPPEGTGGEWRREDVLAA